MTLKSESSLKPFRFVLPRILQQFSLFQKFPYDVRSIIWGYAIFVPGIHFLKFVETVHSPDVGVHVSAGDNSELTTTLSVRNTQDTWDVEWFLQTATLKPVYRIPCADNSYYNVMNKRLIQLRDSNHEAAILVKKVVAQPGNLHLENGQLVMLHQSSDIVCIDYPNMTGSRRLGHWAEHLDLDQLAKIRRLAVRYCHEWDRQEGVCSYCGQVHSYHGGHSNPRHVYEFASLFRNLEEFYFIDYSAVRISPESDTSRQRFASGEVGRTYLEIDPGSHRMHTRAYGTLPWLRKGYITHCRRKTLGPAQPDKVHFGVLGCEWTPTGQRLIRSRRPGSLKNPSGRKRSRKPISVVGPVSLPIDIKTLPIVFGDARKSTFNFNLQVQTRAQ